MQDVSLTIPSGDARKEKKKNINFGTNSTIKILKKYHNNKINYIVKKENIAYYNLSWVFFVIM